MRTGYLSILPVLILLVLAAGVQAAGTMTRTITPGVVAPEGMVTVTLTIDVQEGERFYAIDETPPSALAIGEIGDLRKDVNDHLKYVKLQNPFDTSFTYTMTAPETEGTYTFTGIYQIDGMEDPVEIGGQTTLTVSSSTLDTTTMLIIAVVVIIVIIVAIALVKKRGPSPKSSAGSPPPGKPARPPAQKPIPPRV
jgi:hypothetical protein